MSSYTIILLAFSICLALCLGVLHFFPKWGLMDRPERYGHKRAPIPYPGGIALSLTVMILAALLLPMEGVLPWVLGGGVVLVAVSFWDDRRGVSPYLRFLLQIFLGLLLVFGGAKLYSLSNPFGAPIDLGATHFFWNFSTLFIVAWVVAMINAFNWIDGVPGMTSGVGAVAAATLLMLSIRPDFHSVDQTLAFTLSALLLGASLAIFCFDFPPPRLLMGDTGSMFLGYMLAAIAVVSGGKIATTLLVLGFPILDFFWVILRRIFRGQSPFKGDLWHFHHRLIYAGFSSRQIVLFYMATALLFGTIALHIQTLGKVWTFALILLIMTTLAFFLYARSGSRDQNQA